MYFSHDTGVKFCYLLRENGFSDEDIIRVLRTTKTEDGMYDRSMYIDPREVLIRLYTQKIGPDYEKDAKFCRIIAGMDKKNINEWGKQKSFFQLYGKSKFKWLIYN